MKKYDVLVFIGRFQPLHKGHERVIRTALSLADKVVILVGSASTARSPLNLFTYEERAAMINGVFPEVVVDPINDYTYNDTAWIINVKKTVNNLVLGSGWTALGTNDFKIGLIGLDKDHTSYYLKLFPEWDSVPILPEEATMMHATDIRNQFFSGKYKEFDMGSVLSPSVAKWIYREFIPSEDFALQLRAQQEIDKDKAEYGEGPFLTGDSLVQVGGNILLVTRGGAYGYGLLAMPGGFLKPGERFLDGAIRELKEESNNIKVPVPVLKGSIVGQMLCDEPRRSLRGRIVSQAFHFRLENETKLPEVRGTDDALRAGWYDFSTLSENLFFEDHYHIIKKLLGV